MTTYEFERGFAPRTISDFKAGDKLDFSAFNVSNFNQLDYWHIAYYPDGTYVFFWYNSAPEGAFVANYTITAADFIFNTSPADLVVTGTQNNDDLFGGRGNDILNGGGRADHLDGGAGDDLYYVDNILDDVYERVGEGMDHVAVALGSVYTVYELEAGVEVELLTSTNSNSTAEAMFIGNEFNQTIIGTAGRNALWGGPGDILIGLGGADELAGGTASYHGSKQGVVASLADPSINTNDAAGDTYEYIPDLIGSGFADTLVGDVFANRLSGSGENDTLIGGAERDILVGGTGADAFVLNDLMAYDRISDFKPDEDTFLIDNSVFSAAGPDGPLAAAAFYSGQSVPDKQVHFLYNPLTGGLAYDADGAGGASAIRIAVLGKGLELTSHDFDVI